MKNNPAPLAGLFVLFLVLSLVLINWKLNKLRDLITESATAVITQCQ